MQSFTLHQLRQTIDASVAAARSAVVIGVLGRVAVAAAAMVAAMAILDIQLPGSGFWAGGSGVAAVAGLFLWQLAARARHKWPSRLTRAQAAQEADSQHGETISRAIEFLDESLAEESSSQSALQFHSSDAQMSIALKSLAVSQAAEAWQRFGQRPLPGLKPELLWGVLGGLTVAALWVSMQVLPAPWPAALARQFVPATTRWQTQIQSSNLSGAPDLSGGHSTAVTVRIASPAALGLADAAAFQMQLALVLAERFARSPGLPRYSLSSGDAGEVDRLAAIQADCLAGIAADRATLAEEVAALETAGSGKPSDQEQIRQATFALLALDRLLPALSPQNIQDNRLALASAAAAQAAGSLRQAASALGVRVADRSQQAADKLLPVTMQTRRGLENWEQLTREAAQQALASGAQRVDESATTSPGQTPQQIALAGGLPLEDAGASPSTDGSGGSIPVDPAFNPTQAKPAAPRSLVSGSIGETVDRVWNLLPEQVRPQGNRSDDASLWIEPLYRPAVGAYYQLLLEEERRR